MSEARVDQQIAIDHKNLAALSNAHARATEAKLRDAEKGAIQRLAAPEPRYYDTVAENPNPLKKMLNEKVLSLSALINSKLNYYHYAGFISMSSVGFFSPAYMAEFISTAQAKGCELPRFQEALLAYNRNFPSPLVAGVSAAAQRCAQIAPQLLGVYVVLTLAATGIMRHTAEKIEATFAPDKLTTAASTPWAANVSERVLIKGRLPKIGDPPVQVYARDTKELCELSQVTTSVYGITGRIYQRRACQTFDLTHKDSFTAFAPPVAAWLQLTGVPETDSSVLAKFEALSAQYTRLETQKKSSKTVLRASEDARRQTRAAASVLVGGKP